MGEEVLIRQGKGARHQVRKVVGWSGDVLGEGIVPMVALVQSQEAQKESCGAVGGSGTAVLPVHCCLIIAEGYDGVACQGNEIGEQIGVRCAPPVPVESW